MTVAADRLPPPRPGRASDSRSRLARAIEHHQKGRLAEAEADYRAVLAAEPANASALHHLGILVHQRGDNAEATRLIERAVASAPDNTEFRVNLGLVELARGRPSEAVATLREAVARDPKSAPALFHLGMALQREGDPAGAADQFRKALRLDPGNLAITLALADALLSAAQYHEAVIKYRAALAQAPENPLLLTNLGAALIELGDLAGAKQVLYQALRLKSDIPEACNNLGRALELDGLPEAATAAYRQALACDPDYGQALRNLGSLLAGTGALDEGIACLDRLVAKQPRDVEALSALGAALRSRGDLARAEAELRRAVAIDHHHAAAQNNLGAVLKLRADYSGAEAAFRAALDARPDFAEARSNLAAVMLEIGEVGPALEAYRAAIDESPDDSRVLSNYLFALHYDDSTPEPEVARAHARWAERFAPKGSSAAPPPDPRQPDRRLRVGYVSPDFRTHSVAFFIEPVLARHDRAEVEVFGYSAVAAPDETTRRLAGLCDAWREVNGVSPDRLAAQVREDRIDLLVDLAGHTAGHALEAFLRKPAPVQMSWIGYPDTTGLATIDYRITDARADPPGEADRLHTETLIRLAPGFLCYRPPAESPEPGRGERSGLAFGSFNNLAKVGAPAIAAWARLLEAVPEARLVLKAAPLGDPGICHRIESRFAARGVDPGRLELIGPTKTTREHLALYGRVDIALDTFPYNGTTTTLEALWMGVPVVSLVGTRHAGRVGLSLLAQAGLEGLVAGTVDDYVALAARLAGDEARRAHLHRGLRARLESSPLRDEIGFTRRLEAAYRAAWRAWCASEKAGPGRA
ncbi:MAG: tetratricopeptide repeat protein [Proteobacteria bacterium]|nr:tetratricopeptide repeat protein [Pseudomonadota bacterium]